MTRPDDTHRLAGLHVLVTRPEHQAQALCRLIEREGGSASLIPMLEIAGPADPEAIDALLRRLNEFHIAIFVSANAVDATCRALNMSWPAGLRIAAVGRGTAEALARHGLRVDIQPAQDFRSEGLLAQAALVNVAGQRIVIFRGQGGRELLGDTLSTRGAEVRYAEVYRRWLPEGAAAALDRLIRSQPVDIVIATSNEALLNLYECAADRHRDWLLSRRLVVIGERTAALAATLGFAQSIIAAEASDHGLLEATAAVAADLGSRSPA